MLAPLAFQTPLFSMKFAVLTLAALALAPTWAHADVNIYARDKESALKNKEGAKTLEQFARLSNGRTLYELEFGANVGAPYQFAPDKQIEPTRRPYQPYTPANTPDRNGFASLGLAPNGNWDDFGFFNLYINDIGLEYIAPKMEKTESAAQVTTKFIWQNSQAQAIQTFVLRQNDDKLLMRLDVEPLPNVKIERLVLQLRNRPREANSAYNNPSSLQNALATSSGETDKAGRVDLAQPWAAFLNRDLGQSPSGLLYLPDEVQRAHVLFESNLSRTTLFLKPEQRSFHLALWEVPHLDNAAFVSYLKSAAPALQNELKSLAARDWKAPLPAVAADAPLHLTDAVYKPSAAESARGYVVAPSHPLEYVNWNSLPASFLSELQLRAAPGTTEQAAFSLYSLQELGETKLEWSDLSGPDGKIAASQIDARIVKVWPQQTGVRGGSSGEHLMTPELLVRNDTLPLAQAWTGENTYRPDETGASGFITGPIVANLPRDVTRQFWVMARVPAGARAGVYRGTVTISPAQGEKYALPISLEVLPIKLISPADKYILGIYYRGKLNPDNKNFTENFSPERMKRELEDIRDHGFSAPSLYASKDPQSLATALKIYREVGLKGPVGIEGWGGKMAYNKSYDDKTNADHRAAVTDYLKMFQPTGIEPFFFGIDEPRGDKIEINRKRAEIARKVKVGDLQGKYASAASGKEMEKLIGTLDYPIVSSYFASRQEMRELRDAFRKDGAKPLYYWQIWGEYPKGSRLNAGYFLYQSGFDGVYPYAYRHFDGDPYIEGLNPKSSFKNILASYPSNEGPIPTLQWEAARAGIVDLSYLVTLDELLQRAGDTGKADHAKLDEVLKKYGYGDSDDWGRMIYGALNWPEHQRTVAPEQFDADRRVVADMIAKYQAKS